MLTIHIIIFVLLTAFSYVCCVCPYLDCNSCTSAAACGWCNGVCQSCSGSGCSTSNGASCSSSNWVWLSGNCPTLNACSGSYACASAVNSVQFNSIKYCCLSGSLNINGNSYLCTVPQNCPVDPCAGITCSGHGICNSGICTCTGGYSGSSCQIAPPNWSGYWDANSQCNQSQCCCLTGTFLTSGGSHLTLSGSVSGQCDGTTSLSALDLGVTPTGFTTLATIVGRSTTFTLAPDSNSLTISSLSACNGGATRNTSPCAGITCNGHGTCNNGACTCNAGYGGSNCQNIVPIPNWIGSWSAASSTCSQSVCCCIIGNFATIVDAGNLGTTVSLAGQCSGLTSTTLNFGTTPTWFIATVSVLGQSIIFQLAGDSNSISSTSVNSACNGIVKRDTGSTSNDDISVALIAGASIGGGFIFIFIVVIIYRKYCHTNQIIHATEPDVELQIPEKKKKKKSRSNKSRSPHRQY